MEDVTKNLDSLSFENGLSEDEKKLLHLRARSAALTLSGCAHAVFLCELVHSLRTSIQKNPRHSLASGTHGELCVGIVGMGHMGKQLLLSILEKTSIKPSQIKISTRRPEFAAVPAGVECFFDNGRVAAWADVVFLCCLPSHLLRVSADLRLHLSKHSLVYSFTSAAPISRLSQLLGHSFIIRPQRDFAAFESADVWLSCTHVTAALNNSSLIRATCPLRSDGAVSPGLKLVCAVLYSLLNICTSAGLGSGDTVSVLNCLFKEKWSQTASLNAKSFISSSYASRLLTDKPFPWISLCDAQTKDTPLLRFLSSSKSTQQCISAVYKTLLETQTQRD